jgi:hypothetical protein
MIGRHVDLLGRSLDVPLDAEPTAVLRDYLSAERTASAKEVKKRQSCSSTPNSVSARSSGPGLALRSDILICHRTADRDGGQHEGGPTGPVLVPAKDEDLLPGYRLATAVSFGPTMTA